jgi:outer membrane protein assembly factor BamB
MSDTKSQFSEQPISAKQAASHLPEQPLAADGSAPGALAASPRVQRRLRLWPGVAIIAIQWGVVKTIGFLKEGEQVEFMSTMLGPMIGGVAIFAWWLFASRLRWTDRLLVPAAFILCIGAIPFLGDPTIGMAIMLYVLPLTLTSWVVWLVVSMPLNWPIRRAVLLLMLVLECSYFTLIRFDGVTGQFDAAINWRWKPTPEQGFLAERTPLISAKTPGTEVKPLVLQTGDWPGFRGSNRDNRVIGVTIATDWDKNPPKLLWKHKVGPGWSSFALVGNHLYTQEQWDQKEAAVCYDADTGKMIWFHEYPARFTEAIAGPGPRATPTFHDGKLYSMGAAGKLCCLDAVTGSELWSKDVMADTEAKLPIWGFSASPLIAQGVVMVYAGGAGKAVVAYDADTGKLAWAKGEGSMSYCSLQLATIDGVEQALMITTDGMTSFQPKDGAILWDYQWKLEGVARSVQPGAVGTADFLVGTPFRNGTRRVHVSHKDGQWDNKEVWASRDFSPYFNDFVIHRDHVFGFTDNFFACIGLDKGKAKWKERGFSDSQGSAYGAGQVLLLVDQDLLLIVTEQGAVALIEANPAEQKVLTHFQAIEGKTWNHPVLAHGRLYVRNGEEAACFELAAPK